MNVPSMPPQNEPNCDPCGAFGTEYPQVRDARGPVPNGVAALELIAEKHWCGVCGSTLVCLPCGYLAALGPDRSEVEPKQLPPELSEVYTQEGYQVLRQRLREELISESCAQRQLHARRSALSSSH